MDNINENKIIAETLKKNEEIFTSFIKEMREGLAEKKFKINGMEQLMLKTVAALKDNVVKATNSMATEESKKKLLLAVAEDAEKMKLSQPWKVTST